MKTLTRNVPVGPGSLELLQRGRIKASFDSAFVMMESKNSVETLFRQLASQLFVLHAVAHRFELIWADACAEVVYLSLVIEVLKEAYALVSVSLKKKTKS